MNKWAHIQFFIGDKLFRIGLLSKVIWNNKQPNTVFYYFK